MENSKFYIIQNWMIKKLNLKGLDLLVYAIIYGYSQDGESEFFGSLKYLSEMTGSTKRGVMKSLASLVESRYIFKRDFVTNNIKYTRYVVNMNIMSEMEQSSQVVNSVPYPSGGELGSRGVVNSVQGGGELSSPNNINYNIIDNKNSYSNTGAVKSPTNSSSRNHIPPTIEEVTAYCRERNNGIDPEEFYDFYQSKGWKVGREPMRDWQASVRTFERSHKKKYKPNKIYLEEETPWKAANWLSIKLSKMYPSLTEVSSEVLQKWAYVFDKMESEEGHPASEILSLMKFALQDSFWHDKISNPWDMKKHYIKILAKATDEGWFE